jgi:hypothetical protein
LRIWITLSQLSNIGFTVLVMLVLGVIEPWTQVIFNM